MSIGSAKIHFIVRVWMEKGLSNCEIQFFNAYTDPELFLDLPENERPLFDWIYDNTNEFLSDEPENFLPEEFEICEEPLLCEVIGEIQIAGYTDRFGEYDEDFIFKIEKWTCALDDNEENSD